MTDPYIILNELAQELRPMPQGIEWFEGLSTEEQSNTLRLLSHFCIQARATTEDGPESIRRSGLRATHTPAVLIVRGRIDQQLGKIASLTPHDERLKSFRLLIAVLAIADGSDSAPTVAATNGIACPLTPPKPRPDPSRVRAYRASGRRGNIALSLGSLRIASTSGPAQHGGVIHPEESQHRLRLPPGFGVRRSRAVSDLSATLRPMSLADLGLDQWRSFELPTARRVAQEAAHQVEGHVTVVETMEHLGAPLHRVRIERDGQEFALIPGGAVTLGFDLNAWQPSPAQAADYAESLDQGFGCGSDLRAHLAHVLSPRRSVTLATVLMAVEDEDLTEPPADMPAVLAARGLRMPSSDEWEHGCGAGTDTLFRWGNDCPLDRIPHGDRTGPHQQLSGFGLRIAHDTYRTELTSDVTAAHGGDGGESVCGGVRLHAGVAAPGYCQPQPLHG